MTDFLQLAGKSILVMGVANRKSVAWQTAQVLREAGADVVYAVRSETRRAQLAKLVGEAPIYVCDVEKQEISTACRKAERGVSWNGFQPAE